MSELTIVAHITAKPDKIELVKAELENHVKQRDSLKQQHEQMREQLQQQINDKAAQLASLREQLEVCLFRQPEHTIRRPVQDLQSRGPEYGDDDGPEDAEGPVQSENAPLDAEKISELAEMAKRLGRGRS